MNQLLNIWQIIPKDKRRAFFVLWMSLCSTLSPLYAQFCVTDINISEESCNSVSFSSDADDSLSFLWDFGDGNTSTEPEPTHVYIEDDPGNYEYTVTLIVSGNNCIQDTLTQFVDINISSLPDPMLNSALNPQFTNCSASIQNPEFILLVQNITMPENNSNYFIDWGDGSQPYDENLLGTTQHTYNSIGLFNIVFRVTGTNGCIAEETYEFFNGNTPGVGLSSSASTVSCIPATIQFPFNDEVLDNPVGTTYTLFVDDGSADTTIIQHPPIPPYYDHTFTNSPCDSNLLEYTVTMIAENACNTQTSTSTVKLDRSPEASFEADPDPACEGEIVTVTNTSEPGVYTANNMCLVDMTSFWSISPGIEGIDYTVDGNLGSFPFTPGDSAGFTVMFSTPGEYNILLSYGSATPSVCPRDTFIQSICILEEPEASMINETGNGCFPILIELTNTSNTINSCASADYMWLVNELESECVENSIPPTFIDPTSETTQNATILFQSSGIFEVILIVENICGIDTASTIVEIGDSPVATITPIDTFCNNAQVFPQIESLNSCEGGAITYLWEFPTGNPTSSTIPDPGPVTFNAPGPHTIFLTTTNDCDSYTTQEILHIYDDPPVPDISSNSPICTGETISLMYNNDPGGVEYSWTGPDNFSSTLSNPTIPNGSELNEGTYTLIVTDSISRCSSQANLQVEVFDAQLVQITPEDPSICIGASVTLTATGANEYTWTGPYLNTTTGSVVIVTPPNDLSPLPMDILYTVSGENTSNNCSAIDSIILTINPLPEVSAGDNQSACAGSSFTLIGSPTNGDGGTGIWTGPFVNSNGIFNAPASGTYLLTYTFTDDNNCSANDDVEVCVLDAPEADFSLSSNDGCEGLTVTTTNNSGFAGECTGVSYLWEVQFNDAECHSESGNWSFTSGMDTSENVAIQFLQSGIYDVILNVYSPCDTTMHSEQVSVGTTPILQLEEIDDFCDTGSFIPEIATLLTCNSPVSCLWEFPGADGPQTSNQCESPVLSYSSTGDFQIILTVTNACGTISDTVSFSILENLSASFNIPESACLSPNYSFTPENTSTGDKPTYNWSIDGPGSPIIDNPVAYEPSITVFNPGIYIVSLTVDNPVCAPSVVTDTIEINETPTVTINDIEGICIGGSITPEATFLPGVNFIDSVYWEYPGGNSSTGNPSDPGMIQYLTNGIFTVSVFAFNDCGVDSSSYTFQVLEGPLALATLDTTFACIPGDFTLNVTNQSTGDNLAYNWSISPVGTVSNPIDAEPSFILSQVGWHTIQLEADNGVCPPSSWQDSIFVSTVPDFTLGEINNACIGSPIQPSVTFLNENLIDSVLWEFPGADPSISTDFNPPTLMYGGATGSFTIYLTTYNDCATIRDSVSFELLEELNANAMLDTSFACIPPDFLLEVTNLSSGGNPIYNWSISTPGSVSNSTSFEPVFTLPDTGWFFISLDLTNGGVCPPSSWQDSIFVSTVPDFTLGEINNACIGSPIQPSVTFNNENLIDSVLWEFPGADPSISTDFNPPTLMYGGATGSFTIYLTAYNACTTFRDSVSFELLEELNANAMLDTSFACIPPDFQLPITNLSTGGNPIYDWSISTPGSVSNSTSFEPVFTLPDTGWFFISLDLTNGSVCPPSSWQDSVFISSPPSFNLSPVNDACAGSPITPVVTYTNENLIDSVLWEFPGAIPATANTFDPPTLDYGDSIDVFTFYLTAFNRCGVTRDSISFELLEALNAEAELDTNFACIPPNFDLNVTNLSTGGNPIYEWSVNNPGIVSDPSDSFEPIFTLPDTGWYTIQLIVTNGGVCPPSTWQDSILAGTGPSVDLLPIGDFCEMVELFPLVNFSDTNRIDSVIWSFPGGFPETANTFFPGPITYSGAGDYTYQVTVFNACAITSDQMTFTIDTIPEIMFSPVDTICKQDGLYTIPEPSPQGGIWVGSTGIIAQNPGIFDPGIFPPGDTLVTIFYEYTIGECITSLPKEIMVFDLSFVEAEDIDACISQDTLILNNGMPNGGWYLGTGIIDSLAGIFTPSQIGLGTYTIVYYYQLPFTDCIGTDTFDITVHPLPVPVIQGVDSLCVNTEETIFNATLGDNTYEWQIEDSVYFAENPTHVFQDTGQAEIQLIATSEVGCIDSVTTEVYISGPPIAAFSKDTTEGCATLPVVFTNESIGFQHVTYSWDFGNEEISMLENPDTIFYEDGTVDTTYYITLLAENHCGIDIAEDSILVFPQPQPYFLPSQFSGCTPVTVAFDNFTLGLPDSVWWDLGNGTGTSEFIPDDQIYEALDTVNVIYTVTLYAFNDCGIDSFSQEILVKPEEVRAFFSVEENEGCEPFTVDFNSSSSPDSAIVYNWYFGDFLTSNAEDTTVVFSTTGDTTTIYPVLLVVDNGCDIDSFGLDITVYPAPEISFINPIDSCAGDSVLFINTSPDVNGIFWDFGDGNSSTLNNPLHAYENAGTYPVTLTAFSANNGCPSSNTMEIEIFDNPVAAFSLDTLYGCPPLTVSFSNQSTDGNFYTWDFGNGNTSVGENPGPVLYETSGLFDVQLTVMDLNGCTDDSVYSSVEIFPVPIADFIPQLSEPCGVPQEVCFENLSQGANGFDWDFNNGDQSSDTDPCTDYQNAGNYTVSLTAVNQYLCEDNFSEELTLYEIPMAAFSPGDTSICQFSELTFSNLSSNAETVIWLLNDQVIDTAFNLTLSFPDTGLYSIDLIVGNGSGCADTLAGSIIQVNPTPTADFTFSELTTELPTTYQFTDASSPDAIIFWWDFDDGNLLEALNPRYRFISSFDKEVTHWVGNQYNCWDTVQYVIDLDTLSGLFLPNIMEPNLTGQPGKQLFTPTGIGLSEFHIAIYARNGQLLWESTALDDEGSPTESWDGTYRGQKMPSGTYIWRVYKARYFDSSTWAGMEDEDGELRKSNFFYLVR